MGRQKGVMSGMDQAQPVEEQDKPLSERLVGTSFGGVIEFTKDPPPEETVVEITRDVIIRGAKSDGSRATLDLLSLVVRPLGTCEIENMCIRAHTPGFSEALVLAHCENLKLTNCSITGGYIGLLLASSSEVEMVDCEVSECLYAGVSVDCGTLSMIHCELTNNKVFGVVTAAAVQKQDASSATLEDCKLYNDTPALKLAKDKTPAPGAALAAISGGWLFVTKTEISGFGCGVFVCGPRSLCHIGQQCKVTGNHIGMRLEQQACAHAALETIRPAREGVSFNLHEDIQRVGPVAFYEDAGTAARAHETELSRRLTMCTTDESSVGGLRSEICATRTCFPQPGGAPVATEDSSHSRLCG